MTYDEVYSIEVQCSLDTPQTLASFTTPPQALDLGAVCQPWRSDVLKFQKMTPKTYGVRQNP
jgi:hypothetical protein